MNLGEGRDFRQLASAVVIRHDRPLLAARRSRRTLPAYVEWAFAYGPAVVFCVAGPRADV